MPDHDGKPLSEVFKETSKLGNKMEDLLSKFSDVANKTVEFEFSLGTRVKTLNNAAGYITMLGIDYRGKAYLVEFDDGRPNAWFSSVEFKPIQSIMDTNEIKEENKQKIKSDFILPPDTEVS